MNGKGEKNSFYFFITNPLSSPLCRSDNQERILQRFRIKRLRQEVLVIAPRRSGKTVGMGMFCAAMALSIHSLEISVFATGQRTASKLLKEIGKFIEQAFAYVGSSEQWKVARKNQENIVIVGPDGTERTVGCYPGSVRVSYNSSSFFSLLDIEQG